MNLIRFIRIQFSADKNLYLAIRNLFGYIPGNIHLYKLALIHKAISTRQQNGMPINNERLEYLGDAVLSSVVADYLYKKFPYKDEGFLTEMRSRIVSRSRLNRLARKMGFENLIFTGKDKRTKSKSIFGDTFEAVIGAIYLDKGYYFTSRIIINRIIDVHLDIDEIETTESNFKSRLLEWTQKGKKELEFSVVEEVGEGYNKQYIVEILIDGKAQAQARDFSIKGAEKLAAEKVWNKIQDEIVD